MAIEIMPCRLGVPDLLEPSRQSISDVAERLKLSEITSSQDNCQVFSFTRPPKFQFPNSFRRESSFVALFNKARPHQLIWKAKKSVTGEEVAYIHSILKKEKYSIHINTGTHGNREGSTVWNVKDQGGKAIEKLAESLFLNEDVKLSSKDENTSLTTVSTHQSPIYPEKANHVIDAWCYSFYNTKDLPFAYFKYKIKAKYLGFSKIPLLIGDRTLSLKKHYVALALITEEEKKGCKNEMQNASLDQRLPTYESIFQPKKRIALEKIFESEECKKTHSEKRATLEGAAGIGKTTLCCYIASEWAKGNLWPEYAYLFLIRLRNVNSYPPNISIYRIIEKEYDLPEGTIEKLTEEEKRKTLILLDGCDELQNVKKIKTSEGNFLPLQAFEKTFPYQMIATTRPQSAAPFKKSAKIEILGFDSSGITSYIDRFFPEESRLEKKQIFKWLENPLIYSLCHIPINLEIFCSLAFERKIIPEKGAVTFSSIYIELTGWLLERFGKERFEGTSFKDPENFEEIESKKFVDHLLERAAWEMMDRDTLFLSADEVQEIIGSYQFQSDRAKEIKKTQIGPLRSNGEEVEFVHLTFQEFFAAKYLAKLFKENQLDKALLIIQKKKYDPKYQLVISMASGILAKDKAVLQKFFDQLYNRDTRDLGKTRELVLFAKYFEECGPYAENVKQYNDFIQEVKKILKDPEIPNGVKQNLLRRNSHLLHHKEITNLFVNLYGLPMEEVEKLTEIISNLSSTGMLIPKEIVNELGLYLLDRYDWISVPIFRNLEHIVFTGGAALSQAVLERFVSFLLNPDIGDSGDPEDSAHRLKWHCPGILGEAMQEGAAFSDKTLQRIIAFLLEDKIESGAKRYAWRLLGKIARGDTPLGQKAFELLKTALLDPKIDNSAKYEISSSLEEVIEKNVPFSEGVLERLTSFLIDPKANDWTKGSTAKTIKKATERGLFLPRKAVERMITFVLEPEHASTEESSEDDYSSIKSDGKRYSIEALTEITLKNAPFANEALDGLKSAFQSSSSARKFSAKALGKIFQEGSFFAEKALDALLAPLLESNADLYTKISSAETLEELAKEGVFLPKKAVCGLISLLHSSNVFEKESAAKALGEIAEQESDYAQKALDALDAELFYSRAGDTIFVSDILGKVAKGRSSLAKKALESLTLFFLDPKTGRGEKASVASALAKITEGGVFLSKKVVDGLIAFVRDPENDRFQLTPAAKALERIAERDASFTEKAVEELSSFFINYQIKYDDGRAKNSIAKVLGKIAERKDFLGEKALDALGSVFFHLGDGINEKNAAARVLGEIAKKEIPLPEKAIDGLVSFFLTGKEVSAAAALGEALQRDLFLSEKVLEELIAFFLNDSTDRKKSSLKAVQKIAEGKTAFAEKAFNALSAELLKRRNLTEQNLCVETMEKIAQGDSFFAEKAVDILSDALLKDFHDSNKRKTIAVALGKIAREGILLPEKALSALSALLKYDPSSYKSPADLEAVAALEKAVEAKTPLSEKLAIEIFVESHESIRLDQLLDKYLDNFIIQNEGDVRLLSQICARHEKAFYLIDGKHFVSDQKEIREVCNSLQK